VEIAGREVRTVRRILISAGRSPFALRHRMTEGTSHLAGLWIGAAISNTSHSMPVLTLSNEHGSQVKDQGRWQCCHNKYKNFPIGLHVLYFYFPDAPRTSISKKNLLHGIKCAVQYIFYQTAYEPHTTVALHNSVALLGDKHFKSKKRAQNMCIMLG
jgi:hypothetical protein